MAQLALNKGKVALTRTETVKISGPLLSQRIQQFSLTLIGRLMNPEKQRMKSLVTNLPKIWKLEDRVVGIELGMGKFQFNFQNEEDLHGVLANNPYHFDGWMVSLVKWEPIISSIYPSTIIFWVKVTWIPLHLWEDVTHRAVGKTIGVLKDVDVDSWSVLVVVPFDSGDEVVVSLEYVKLSGFCQHYFRLTHDVSCCPEIRSEGERGRVEQFKRRSVHIKKENGQENEGTIPVFFQDEKDVAAYASGEMHQRFHKGTNYFDSSVVMEEAGTSLIGVDKAKLAWPKPLYHPKATVFGAKPSAPAWASDGSIYRLESDGFYQPDGAGLMDEDLLDSQEDTGTENNVLENGELSTDKTVAPLDEQAKQDPANQLLVIDEDHILGAPNLKNTVTQARGANQIKKKGTVALPKPPAQT